MIEVIGWSASAVLVLTIGRQVYRQWQAGTSRGVSKWLFIGQITASSGFLVYSWLIGDAVFLTTNVLLLVAAVAGLAILMWHRRRESA